MNQDELSVIFTRYFHEATRLKEKYSAEIEILIGMEIDWIRPSSLAWVNDLLRNYRFDLFIGSVHHVHTIPIDYDHEMYMEARALSGGSDERLFEDYFDLQYEMLQSLKPPLVGHFDLIRLKSEDPDADFLQWSGVLQKVSRNLDLIVAYGGVMELNSAGLRKGMREPYPTKAVCKVSTAYWIRGDDLALTNQRKLFLAKGGQFTFSDDCHSAAQVGTHYRQLLQFAADTGINAVKSFGKAPNFEDMEFPNIITRTARLEDLTLHAFFNDVSP